MWLVDDGSSGWFLGVGADTDTRLFASWSFELGLLFPLFSIPRLFPFLAYSAIPPAYVGGFHKMPVYDHDASPLSFVDLATTR